MNGMEKSKIEYQLFEGVPKKEHLSILLDLYSSVFKDAKIDFFTNRIYQKEDVLSIVALKKRVPIGFKIGYQYNKDTFYSWVGGILPSYRKQGIAQNLIDLQHTWAKERKYLKIKTKSMNRFKPMIILNLKNGFNIMSVYTNNHQQTKIIFEKNL